MKKLSLLLSICILSCTHNIVPTVYVPPGSDTTIIVQGTPGPKGDKGDPGKDAPIPTGDINQPFPQIQTINQDGTTKVVPYFPTIVEVNSNKHYIDSLAMILQNEIDAYRAAKAEKYHRHQIADIDSLSERLASINNGTGVGPQGPQGIQGVPGITTIINQGGTGTSSVLNIHSVTDFGVNSGNSDNIVFFEKARDYCYANDATLYIPTGNYHISRTWVLRNKNSVFSTIKIIGESNPWSSRQGSVITADFNDAPVIALQLNKGSIINGITTVGKFIPQGMYDNFWNTPFEKWGSGARDSRYSPQCGIAIDAFTNSGFPPDGGYPTLQAEYNIAPERGGGGSTGVQILNCVINNCVVGVCCSPNGQTQNDEEVIIDNIDFTNCKTGVSGGQPQEKNNILSNFASWGGTHTCFSQGVYGYGGAGNWGLKNANLAGAVVQLVNINSTAWFPTFISGIFAESLGRFGPMSTQMSSDISDCHLDFQDPSLSIGYTPVIVASGMVKFDACVFRYYNGAVPGQPLVISGGIYENTTFSGTPIDVSGGNAMGINYSSQAEYYNCRVDGYGAGPWRLGFQLKNVISTATKFNRYGDFSIKNSDGTKISFDDNTAYYSLYIDNPRKTISLNNLSFSFQSDHPEGYYVGGAIAIGQNNEGFGVVTAITGNTITVGSCTPSLSGDYFIFAIYPNNASISFTGDITGPNEISNIKLLWGDAISSAVGNIFPTSVGTFKVTGYDVVSNKYTTLGILPAIQNNYLFK